MTYLFIFLICFSPFGLYFYFLQLKEKRRKNDQKLKDELFLLEVEINKSRREEEQKARAELEAKLDACYLGFKCLRPPTKTLEQYSLESMIRMQDAARIANAASISAQQQTYNPYLNSGGCAGAMGNINWLGF